MLIKQFLQTCLCSENCIVLIDLLHVTYNWIHDGNMIYFLKWRTAVFIGEEKLYKLLKALIFIFYKVCVYAYFTSAVF